ncbi:pyridoxamine 5'-phosphate oxidase family protein [Desulfitobacterium sp. Sab5]|uniref:pyridoxamine 5'-phosphate oxidase family protein n=1 Tax=Desulfitobacterium nosdiversum TaxID=3375356 RepID=UPI003CF7721E
MFRELRRQDLKMDNSTVVELLQKGEFGTLSTVDVEGYPYGVPLSYVYNEKTHSIYFHVAREGYKLDNIAANPKASFCVIGEGQTLPERFSVKFQSAIAFGRMSEVDEVEKREALVSFLTKYSKAFMENGLKYLEVDEMNCRVFKLEIEYMTGKNA